jgi:hypothetical protein
MEAPDRPVPFISRVRLKNKDKLSTAGELMRGIQLSPDANTRG